MEMILFILIAIGAIILSVWFSRQRAKEWLEFSTQHGFNYFSKDTEDLPSRYSDFNLFNQGHSRKAYNVCTGANHGIKLCLFDYQYTTGSGKNQQTHYRTVLITDKRFLFQPLDIRPENIFDKIGAAIGFDDIDFESAEFSRRFYVKSPDKKFAYDIIHPRMMEFLLETKNLTIEARGTEVLFHHGKQLKMAELEILIMEAEGFYKQIPDYMLKDNQISPQ